MRLIYCKANYAKRSSVFSIRHESSVRRDDRGALWACGLCRLTHTCEFVQFVAEVGRPF